MPQTFVTDQFQLVVTSESVRDAITVTHIHATDRFAHPRHRMMRRATQAFLNFLEGYLRAHPEVVFETRGNLVRTLVYLPAGIRAWTPHMPGAFATYPVHNPDVPRIKGGKRLDILTKNLFRHSADGTGLRSRSYVLAWLVAQRYGTRTTRLRWLSLGTGTGHQTLEAARCLKRPPELWLTDIDQEVLEFASALAAQEVSRPVAHSERLDALDSEALAGKIKSVSPQVIDAMGLVEYLDDEQLVQFVRTIRTAAPRGCQVVFTNMRPTHPGLEVHRRGLGWPGVIVRTDTEVSSLLVRAGVRPENIHVVLPDDHVYGIYEFLV